MMALRRPWEAGGRGKERVNLSELIGQKWHVSSTLALRGRRIEDADARPPHPSGGIPANAVAPKVCWILLGIMHAGYCARMPAKRCSKMCAGSHAGTPDGRKCGLGAPQGLQKTAKLSQRDAKCGQDASKSVFFGNFGSPRDFFCQFGRS